MVVLGIGAVVGLIHGAFTLSFDTLCSGIVNAYFFITAYSLQELLKFEGEQVPTFQTAGNQSFGKQMEPDYEKGNVGYQPQPSAPTEP